MSRPLHKISFSRLLSAPLIVVLLMALTLTSLAIVQAEPNTQAQFGTGWTGEFFSNPNLQDPVAFVQQFPTGLNINWGAASPAAGIIPVDQWSARFTSVQLFNEGTYEFVVASDDGVRVYIDNNLVLDRFIGRTLTTDRFQLSLTAGTHSIRIEYFDGIDQAALQFQWFQIAGIATPFPGDGSGGVVPGQPTPIPACTGVCATVTGVRGLALRTGPYLGASFVTTLTQDSTYQVLGRNRDEGIYNWYRLQVGDRQGWASGRYLTLTVDVNTVPLVGSGFDNIDNAPEYGVIAHPRAVMNMRHRPSIRTSRVGSIPWGAPVQVIGRTIQAGIPRWYQVRYNGVVGWIDARWVSVSGEIYAVPIR